MADGSAAFSLTMDSLEQKRLLMLCTSCSSPVTPIVSFDIDGTMGRYHEHLCHFAATYLGYATWDVDYDGQEPFRDWFCDEFKVDLRTFRDIKLAYRQGGMKRSMPVRDWARVACNLARDWNAEVWVTTTRPYMRLDNVDPDTRFWLKRHGIKYDHLIYGEHKYEDLRHQVDPSRVAFVLDDLAEQISQATRLFDQGACWMYRTPWNRAHHIDYPGVANPEDIYSLIKERITSWKIEHSSSA